MNFKEKLSSISTPFFCISFIVLFLFSICTLIILSSINDTEKKQSEQIISIEKLAKNQNKQIQIPEALNQQIISEFKNAAEYAKAEICGANNIAVLEIKESTKKKLEEQTKNLQNIQNNFEESNKKFEAQRKHVQETVDTAKKQIVSIYKQASDEIKNDAKKQFELQGNALQNQMVQIRESQKQLQPTLGNLTKNIESVVKSNKQNHIDAENAIVLAKKAIKSNNLQLAMIYALNAINHDSSNIEYLNFYNNLLKNKKDLTVSDIDQFVSVLDLAVYQIKAAHVQTVVVMKDTLLEKRASMVSAITEAKNKEAKEQINKQIADLRTGKLALIKIVSGTDVDEALLKERIEVISYLLSDASLSEADHMAFTADLRYATGLYPIVSTLNAANNSLVKAISWSDKNRLEPNEILTARNQLQTANTMLSQIWSTDCSQYQNFKTKAENIQTDIANIDKKLNILASADAKAEIEKLIEECNNTYKKAQKIRWLTKYEYRRYTNAIDSINKNLNKISIKIGEIYDIDLRKDLSKEIEKLPPKVTELSKERYKTYQSWAIEKLNNARIKWDTTTIVTDNDAKKMFNDYILEINTSLLLPDVNTLYNSIYQLIYDQLPNKAEMQYKKATHPVKHLEDF